MERLILVSYIVAGVFGFIFINYGLYHLFDKMFESPQTVLIIAWGAIVISCLFYFGIIRGDFGE